MVWLRGGVLLCYCPGPEYSAILSYQLGTGHKTKTAEVGYETQHTVWEIFTGTWFLLKHITHYSVSYFMNIVPLVHA